MAMPMLSLLFYLLMDCSGAANTLLGVNYGQIGNNLPDPRKAVGLVKSIGASHVKLYDANPRVLSAFANTGISFTLGLGNEYLSQMRDPAAALSWVQRTIVPHIPNTLIPSVAVGNEVLTFNDTSLISNLLPAMRSLRNAITSLNLTVAVTTPHSLSVLLTSYPPSAATFRPDLSPTLQPILDFLDRTGAPFLVNAYPFFAYMASPDHIPIDFALFQPNPGLVDPATGLRYDNMLFSQVDAIYYALKSAGFRGIPVQVSETGWPSKGDSYEIGASLDNARKYNGNLIRRMRASAATPLKPSDSLIVYVFALFNENMKPGPSSERNYGLFKPDGTPAYDMGLGTASSSSFVFAAENSSSSSVSSTPVARGNDRNGKDSSSDDGGAGDVGNDASSQSESSSTGYLSVSPSAAPAPALKGRYDEMRFVLVALLAWLLRVK